MLAPGAVGYANDLGIFYTFSLPDGGIINLASPQFAPALTKTPDMAPILLLAKSPLLEAYQVFLADEGFLTIAGASLAQVLSISQARAVSLVLLDIGRTRLSEPDVELCQHLRAVLAERHVPLLLVFPGITPANLVALHADYGLNKPFSPLEFSDIVRHLVARDRPVRRATDYALPPILHTDDDRENLKLIKLLLGQGSFPVITTTDSYEVLRLCRTQPISLVISDVLRPDMNGFELLGHLREEHPAYHIPFIFFSARWRNLADKAEQALLDRLRPDDYLVKPCHASEILDRVQRVLLVAPFRPLLPGQPADRPYT